MKVIILLFLFYPLYFIFANQLQSKLIINIDKFNNDKGKAYVAVFNNGEAFSMNGENALKYGIFEIKNRKLGVEFNNLDYGKYAVSVFHDENNDGKLNKNFLGIPKESIGVSNNVKNKFGPPTFEQAKFNINQSVIEINIQMQ